MKKSKLLALLVVLSTSAHAVPIDWRGAFGVDTTLLNSFRRIESTSDNSSTGSGGSQEAALASGKHANASFQSYLFRLNPVMVVNDAATIKAEITSGYGRGGIFGDSSTENKHGSFGNALYYYNTSSASQTANNTLLLSKLYAELYSDTATWILGRQSAQWGMGLLYNSGEGVWDRHTYVRDGLTMKVKFSNFHIAPYYAVLNSGNSLTRATKSTEYGTTLLYDNPERDLTLGLLYAKRENDAFESGITTEVASTDTSARAWGKSNVKITDIYLKKNFNRFTFTAEIPMMSGEMGNLFNEGGNAKYKAKAIVGQSSFKLNDAWKFSLNAGTVSGDAGSKSSFDAMYLNPNYQIASILFHYNLYAVSNPANYNIFDAYVTNAKFLRFQTDYNTEKWNLNWALVTAKANEVAKAGHTAFNHSTNKLFAASYTQSDNLGTEVDVNATYHWNNDIDVGASGAYLFTGDYWAYTNTANANKAKSGWLLQARTGISF